MPDEIRAPGPLLRLTRLLIGRNQLGRTSDRIEGLVLTMLLAALVGSVVAAFVLSAHVYRSQRASAARLHPVMAVLSQNGPGDNLNGYGQAATRWRAPGGRERSGLLTTVTARGIWGAAARARSRCGSPDPAPRLYRRARTPRCATHFSLPSASSPTAVLCWWSATDCAG